MSVGGRFKTTFQNKVEEVENRLTDMFNTLKSDIYIDTNRADLSEVKSTISELEKSQTFQGESLKEIGEKFEAKLSEIEAKYEAKEGVLKANIDALEEKLLQLETHGRKYSLLLYGYEEPAKENIYGPIKAALIEDCKIDKERVDKMIFANAHRLPTCGTDHRPVCQI